MDLVWRLRDVARQTAIVGLARVVAIMRVLPQKDVARQTAIVVPVRVVAIILALP